MIPILIRQPSRTHQRLAHVALCCLALQSCKPLSGQDPLDRLQDMDISPSAYRPVNSQVIPRTYYQPPIGLPSLPPGFPPPPVPLIVN